MDKFEIFNRSNGTWETYSLVAGWQENFVTDKTTDTGVVKLKYTGTEFPKIDIGDWCRLIHSDDGNVSYQHYTEIRDYDFVTKYVEWQVDKNYSYNNKTYFKITASFKNNTTFQVPIAVYIKYNLYYSFEGSPAVENMQISAKFNFEANSSSTSDVYLLDRTTWDTLDDIFDSIYCSPDEAGITSSHEYIQYDIPQNHAQYFVSDVSMIKDTPNNEIDIQLNLKEPIEYLRGVLCETRNFSNQTEKVQDGNKYFHKKHSHLSVLEDILKTTPANNNLSKSWYSRIKVADRQILSEKAFNDDTYSELSLYEILMNKYDSALGRTPVLYFDINGATDLPYNMNRPEYVLRFEKQDGTDKEEIQYSALEENAGQVLYKKSFENFAKGLVTNYDNMTTNQQGNILLTTAFAIPEVDTTERSLEQYTEQKGDWIIRTPHNIKSVKNVIKYIVRNASRAVTFETYDSNNILTQDQYTANASLYENVDAVWYVEGENKIHINEAHYTPIYASSPQTGYLYAYYVEYEPLITGRIEVGDEYQVQVNQVDSQINATQYGEYLKEYLDSMDKADITITKTIENYADIYPITTRVVNGDKKYIITNVSVKNRGIDYEVVYQLNENHIRRNDSIAAPQTIRTNIDIGIDATKERRSALIETYKLSMTQYEDEQKSVNKQLVFSPLLNNYDENNFPKIAIMKFKSYMYSHVSQNITTHNIEKELACDIVRFYSANTIWFNMRYYDNAEAGKKKILQQRYAPTLQYPDETFYATPNQQIPVLYTDAFGEFDTFSISFNRSSANLDDIKKTFSGYETDTINSLLKSADYPLASIKGESVFDIENINYKKQRLDTLNYTFGIKIESDPNIIICEPFFTNHNLLDPRLDYISTAGIRITYIPPFMVKTFDKNISAEDISTYTPTQTTEVTTCSYNNGEITINLTDTLNSAKCIALCRLNSPMVIIHDYDKYVGGNFNQVKLFC